MLYLSQSHIKREICQCYTHHIRREICHVYSNVIFCTKISTMWPWAGGDNHLSGGNSFTFAWMRVYSTSSGDLGVKSNLIVCLDEKKTHTH